MRRADRLFIFGVSFGKKTATIRVPVTPSFVLTPNSTGRDGGARAASAEGEHARVWSCRTAVWFPCFCTTPWRARQTDARLHACRLPR